MIRVASSVCTLFTLLLFPLYYRPLSFLDKPLADARQILLLLDYQNPSSYTHDVTTSPTPSLPSYSLALAPYKQYSPCELRLKDPNEDTETVTSVAIFISDKTNASTAGVEWSADNPAPKVAVDAGVATATSDSAGTDHKRIERIVWAFVGAVAAVTVLL